MNLRKMFRSEDTVIVAGMTLIQCLCTRSLLHNFRILSFPLVHSNTQHRHQDSTCLSCRMMNDGPESNYFKPFPNTQEALKKRNPAGLRFLSYFYNDLNSFIKYTHWHMFQRQVRNNNGFYIGQSAVDQTMSVGREHLD